MDRQNSLKNPLMGLLLGHWRGSMGLDKGSVV